jgi:rhamnosyltransferase subunit B
VIEAFQNELDYEVILTTGAFIHPDAVPKITNIHTERFIPGSVVIQNSQAVIHCGGNGSTYQALSQGKPAIAIPFNNEQTINAWLMKKHNIGIPLSPNNLTGEQLKSTIKSLVKDVQIRESIQRFTKLLISNNSVESAAEEISNFFYRR